MKAQTWEDEADRFAARILIPSEYEYELRRLTLTDVPDFADRLGIDPGIVIGRLHHDGLIPNHRGNELPTVSLSLTSGPEAGDLLPLRLRAAPKLRPPTRAP